MDQADNQSTTTELLSALADSRAHAIAAGMELINCMVRRNLQERIDRLDDDGGVK